MKSGANLGPYRILEKIGEGGIEGEVYRADDSRLQRTVAIKILARRLATPDCLERFQQEARATSVLMFDRLSPMKRRARESCHNRDSFLFPFRFYFSPTLL